MRLKPEDVADAIRSGVNQKIPDGNNLYLVVRNGRGFWVHQYRDGAVIRSTGLGSAAKVTPKQARLKREAFTFGRRNGPMPPAPLPAPFVAASLSAAVAVTGKTFGEAVRDFIADRAAAWKGGAEGSEAKAYRRTLLGSGLEALPLAAIDTAAVLATVKSMPAVTAEKTRTRIATILDWAKALGYRHGENPARRRGHMEHLLNKVPQAKHHTALPWADVPALMRELKADGSVAAQALLWTILTAARSGETRSAERKQIQGDTWICPPEIMKEGREHQVPLSKEALALIGNRKGCLFHITRDGMKRLLGKLRPGFTVHGMRSSFTDWAADHDYPSELREMALAHAVGDAVEQAYRHSTRINKRREMMTAWSNFALGECGTRA
jgi:integrase